LCFLLIWQHMAKKSLAKKLARIEQEELNNTRGFAIRSLKATADSKRTFAEKFADWITSVSGSVPFLVVNILWFTAWISINEDLVPGIAPFDPYPFGFLTMCVSLEAIALAILVLISQNRGAHVADVREEIDLNINRIAEAEITQIIKMLAKISEKHGIDINNDPELARMMRPLSSGDIQRKIEKASEKNEMSIPIPIPELPNAPWEQNKRNKKR